MFQGHKCGMSSGWKNEMKERDGLEKGGKPRHNDESKLVLWGFS